MSQEALDWFKKEFDTNDENFRFYVRYGGGMAGRIPGFSLGINVEQPEHPHTTFSKDGLSFFIEESDVWYFEDHDLLVNYDDKKDEPRYEYS